MIKMENVTNVGSRPLQKIVWELFNRQTLNNALVLAKIDAILEESNSL
jgi:hypothetical protein